MAKCNGPLLQIWFITKYNGIMTNCDSLVYYKLRWTVVTNCDSFFITRCDTVYYKLRQVLQSGMDLLQIVTGITKCDDYYKLRLYRRHTSSLLRSTHLGYQVSHVLDSKLIYSNSFFRQNGFYLYRSPNGDKTVRFLFFNN